ncbi:class I SAM-dependent methyltransferase [Gammaproteobacteria bacterium]|nr:class I SAM-dependent methyltransferase [Gammaproteobacteria bacterium]
MITSNNGQKWEECYLCGHGKSKYVYLYKGLKQCLSCSFVHYDSIPSTEDLDLVYSKYTREEYITDASVSKIRKELSNILNISKINRVLDIACGECYFLDVLQSINPDLELFATEHSSAKENVKAKGYNFIEGEFFPITNLTFDLIIFTEAIEHTNDVNRFLSHASNLLNPGGIIYITTPNFSSLERRLMGEKWGMIMPPEHLSYFTPKTLEYCMLKNGFKKRYSRTENISIFRVVEFFNLRFFKSQDPKEQNLSPQIISDNLQQFVESNFLIRYCKTLINVFLNLFNLGSSLKAMYQKK